MGTEWVIGVKPAGQSSGAMLGLPIQLIEEDRLDLASRRDGAARRLESRRPQCARSAAATRLRGAPPRCGATASRRAVRPHAAAHGPGPRGLHAACRPAGRQLAESSTLLRCLSAGDAPDPGRSRPSSLRKQTGRRCALCGNRRSTGTWRRRARSRSSRWMARSIAWRRSTLNWPGSSSFVRLADSRLRKRRMFCLCRHRPPSGIGALRKRG